MTATQTPILHLSNPDDAMIEVGTAFANFEAIGKWDVYEIVFDLMDRRKITLNMIQMIGSWNGIPEHVIRMRRLQWVNMRKA